MYVGLFSFIWNSLHVCRSLFILLVSLIFQKLCVANPQQVEPGTDSNSQKSAHYQIHVNDMSTELTLEKVYLAKTRSKLYQA